MHGHGHGHGHDPHAAHDGPVVVDVGDGVGALVLRTDASMAGDEIEIAADGDAARTHVAVHPRTLPGGRVVHAAVYPSLPEGEHRLWHPDGSPPRTVVVRGGEVADVAWADLPVASEVVGAARAG